MLTIKDYTPEKIKDVEYILSNLRSDDRKMFGDTFAIDEVINLHTTKMCELRMAYWNEEPICTFGLTERYPFLSWRYMAFHMGTDKIDEHRKSFVKIGRQTIEEWLDKHGNIYMTAFDWYKKSFIMARAFGFKFKMNIHEVYIFVKER